jgi:hypothetical protein
MKFSKTVFFCFFSIWVCLPVYAADNISIVKNYYSNLRKCTPGTYQFTRSFALKRVDVTSTITGRVNGLCNVEEQLSGYGDSKEVISQTCQYSDSTLALFTDEEAVALDKGDYGPNYFLLGDAFEKECGKAVAN